LIISPLHHNHFGGDASALSLAKTNALCNPSVMHRRG
jgi:hypothetical protein